MKMHRVNRTSTNIQRKSIATVFMDFDDVGLHSSSLVQPPKSHELVPADVVNCEGDAVHDEGAPDDCRQTAVKRAIAVLLPDTHRAVASPGKLRLAEAVRLKPRFDGVDGKVDDPREDPGRATRHQGDRDGAVLRPARIEQTAEVLEGDHVSCEAGCVAVDAGEEASEAGAHAVFATDAVDAVERTAVLLVICDKKDSSRTIFMYNCVRVHVLVRRAFTDLHLQFNLSQLHR